MRNIWTIAKKEFSSYFHSPIAYIVGVVIFLLLGIIFWIEFSQAMQTQTYAPDPRSVLGLFIYLMLLCTPFLTMRTITEENRMGTLELLLTAPVRDHELIIGKWLGTMLFFLVMIAMTWIYPIILNFMVKPGIDQAVLVVNYLGIILLASALTAIGVFISSLFSNQVAAMLTGLGVMLLLWLMTSLAQFAQGFLGDLLRYIGFIGQYSEGFMYGVIELKSVVYFISMTVLCLFLGSRVIESRRWK